MQSTPDTGYAADTRRKDTQRQPIYAVSVDGRNITPTLDSRLISLTLTDNRGFEADTLELSLSDADGQLQLPPKGAKVSLSIGWTDTGLIDKGSYTVDEIEHSGAPDQLSIRARSADLRAGLTTKRDQSWHATTVGEIVNAIAGRNGLQPAISPALASRNVIHLDQTGESDANLLTRLAEQHGAITTVKDDRLLFITAGAGLSASGKPLPAITIERKDGDSHRFAVADRESYTGVRASYFDVVAGTRGEVLVNANTAQLLREQHAARVLHAQQAKQLLRDKHAEQLLKAQQTVEKLRQQQALDIKMQKRKRGKTGTKLLREKQAQQLLKAQQTVDRLSDKQALEQLAADTNAQPETDYDPTLSDTGNVKTLRHTYANKSNALTGARSAWEKLQRGVASFSITLAHGRPELMPELPTKVVGFKPQIDAVPWLLTKVMHNLGDGGYTTALELEARLEEVPD